MKQVIVYPAAYDHAKAARDEYLIHRAEVRLVPSEITISQASPLTLKVASTKVWPATWWQHPESAGDVRRRRYLKHAARRAIRRRVIE